MLKLLKFFIGGFLTYFINIWFTYWFVNILWFHQNISYLISMVLVIIVNFFISLFFTFNKKYSHKMFINYLFFLVLLSIMNYFLVLLVSSLFDINYYFIIFSITTLIFFIKFIVYDKFVFSEKNKII